MEQTHEEQIRNLLHANDGVWEKVQTAMETACEQLGLDPEEFLWSIQIEKAED